MSTAPQGKLTAAEYLEIERSSEFRHEFYQGEMFAMTGASREHNLICGNILRHIHAQFDGRPCEVYQSDMRVRVNAADMYTYPDVVATCGEPQLEDNQFDTLLNPLAIVEVLSDSTEAYDRGTKFTHYRSIESLRDYVLVAQNMVRVERYSRTGDGQWLLWSTDDLIDRLELPSIECQVTVSDIYARIKFEQDK